LRKIAKRLRLGAKAPAPSPTREGLSRRDQSRKSPAPVQGAKYVFDAWILPELGAHPDRTAGDRSHRPVARQAGDPAKRVRSKRTAMEPATRATADDLPILRACARRKSSVQL